MGHSAMRRADQLINRLPMNHTYIHRGGFDICRHGAYHFKFQNFPLNFCNRFLNRDAMEPFFSFSFFSILNRNFRLCDAWKICWCSGPRRLLLLKVAIDDEKRKRRAMQTVAGVEGVESVAVDMKEKKITVIGDADPVSLTIKLRKFGSTELLSVGPAKEEKKDDKKKPATEKKEEKKDDGKKEEKKEEKKAEPPKVIYMNPSSTSYVPYQPGYSYTVVKDEDNSTCTIC